MFSGRSIFLDSWGVLQIFKLVLLLNSSGVLPRPRSARSGDDASWRHAVHQDDDAESVVSWNGEIHSCAGDETTLLWPWLYFGGCGRARQRRSVGHHRFAWP